MKSAPIGALLAQKFTFVELQKKTKTHLSPVFFVSSEKCSKAKILLKVWGKKTFMVKIMDIEFV